MKIFSWNIKQGGGKRIKQILEHTENWNPDLLFLLEYQPNQVLCTKLQELGYELSFSQSESKENSILCASKVLKLSKIETPESVPESRWLELKLEQFNLLCAHVPGSGDKYSKIDFWEQLLKYADEHKADQTVIMGDFNTGFKADTQGTAFAQGERLEQLVDLGWTDLMKHFRPEYEDFTWYSRTKNGFRLDHAFGSMSTLPLIKEVDYLHKARKTEASDHSAVMIASF